MRVFLVLAFLLLVLVLPGPARADCAHADPLYVCETVNAATLKATAVEGANLTAPVPIALLAKENASLYPDPGRVNPDPACVTALDAIHLYGCLVRDAHSGDATVGVGVVTIVKANAWVSVNADYDEVFVSYAHSEDLGI